jgi:hypothetical protein
MEAHRCRRTKDHARKTWYAYYRQLRFARWLGSIEVDDDLIHAFQVCDESGSRSTVAFSRRASGPWLS